MSWGFLIWRDDSVLSEDQLFLMFHWAVQKAKTTQKEKTKKLHHKCLDWTLKDKLLSRFTHFALLSLYSQFPSSLIIEACVAFGVQKYISFHYSRGRDLQL